MGAVNDQVRLADLGLRVGERFVYDYDFAPCGLPAPVARRTAAGLRSHLQAVAKAKSATVNS